MEVDYSVENQLHLCPRDFLKPMSLVMDDRGSLPHPRSSGLRVSTKSKAPSPPGLKKLDPPGFSQWIPGSPHLSMDLKENLIDKDLSLVVVLPGGEEKITTVHGSKPLMDLLVTLCAKYHLNPSSHTLELVTTNKKNTKLKPNALIGTLDAEKIVLKPKGEDKNKKTGPQMPEATVRMVINYRKTQKTILRVNPRVPLADHLPAICEKCEFDVETTVLLRDVQSLAPLDLSCSLNDYAMRELYARDSKGQRASPVSPSSPTLSAVFPGKDKNQKEEENKGLLSKFRKSKKKSDQAVTASAPASPVLVSKPRPLSMALPSSNSSLFSSAALLGDAPKKRRAPLPPVVVSPGATSDLTTRRRLHSEPNTRLEREQIALSRGSSGESSLKRTKRKAPPPPTSTSPVGQHMGPVDEDLPGVTTANTLGEISELEESTTSVKSAPASDTQGEDSSLNMSADISLPSPSPETDIVSTVPVEGNGDDQSRDLSSDGNHLQSPVNDPAAPSDVMTAVTASPEPGDTDQSQHESEKEPAPESVQNDDITVPSDLPPPVTQEAEAQASAQENTETICEQTDGLESPVATSTSHSTAEDAQVQTDIPPPSVPSPQPIDGAPSSPKEPALESAEKKDMATTKQELERPDLKQDLPHNSETSCQDSTASAPATTKAPCIYSRNSEPKPKPSNELTRDYIPKVGMTTFTIVPQKSLEKLRYFEVALTLESLPPVAKEEGLDIGSLQLEESTAQKEQKVSEEKKELQSSTPREELLTSATTTNHTVNGSIPELTQSASPTRSPKPDVKTCPSAAGASQASSPTEVKEVKIPPATKPKPGSFRLAQHKKVPGYYVTSAVGKSLSASSSSGQREAQNAERAQFLPPPPPPPPVQSQEDTTGDADVELSPKREDKHEPIMRFTRQSSLPTKEPRSGLSLEKLRSFAAPRPYSPATQSRFAQAVSSAVKRSQSLSYRATPPRSPSSEPVSPITGRSPAIESKGSSNLKDSKNGDMDSDKGSILQAIVNEAPSLSGIVLMEAESSP